MAVARNNKDIRIRYAGSEASVHGGLRLALSALEAGGQRSVGVGTKSNGATSISDTPRSSTDRVHSARTSALSLSEDAPDVEERVLEAVTRAESAVEDVVLSPIVEKGNARIGSVSELGVLSLLLVVLSGINPELTLERVGSVRGHKACRKGSLEAWGNSGRSLGPGNSDKRQGVSSHRSHPPPSITHAR